MTLVQLEEWRTDRVIFRLAACDCNALCALRMLIATLPGAHEDLWLGSVIGPAEDMGRGVAAMLDESNEDMPVTLERALALCGLPWEVVSASREAALVQIAAVERLPAWMFRLPRGLLWQTRACTFGPDLTRVPRALWVLKKAYAPDGPYRLADYAQDPRWAEVPLEGPARELWGES
jgi:hypothetical protein